ncbi:MAG: YfiH family protein [Gammaproteobacteria bacterium]|jgi:YfiH family protein
MTKQPDNFWLWADWPTPKHVRAGTSLRSGGISMPPFNELNLGLHVGDETKNVLHNREFLSQHLKLRSDPFWLDQIHSNNIIALDDYTTDTSADGSYTTKKNNACTIMAADCVPILFCNAAGTKVAAIHAGWKGICNGIIEKAANLFSNPDTVFVWIGPCISGKYYEVGRDVYEQCLDHETKLKSAFIQKNEDHWHCELAMIVKIILKNSGVGLIYESGLCTYKMDKLFYSYRREVITGRTASMIWME